MMGSVEQNALDRAIAYLGAVEVAPETYAFEIGETWHLVARADLFDLADLYGCIETSCHSLACGLDEWMRTTQLTVMPAWWSPERPFVLHRKFGINEKTFASLEEARREKSGRIAASYGILADGDGYDIFTADLETGQEVSA